MPNAVPSPQGQTRILEVGIAQMSALVESQLGEAVAAFERRDVASAERVISVDKRIDALHRQIEGQVMTALSEHRLAQGALREVVATMKIAGELERIGDLAKNVSKRTLVLSQERPVGSMPGVSRMGRASLRQVSAVLDAYATLNPAAARAVWGGDDDLDELYNSVFREILLAMMEDPKQVSASTHLVFIAKNFERVGDHATNIAETVHYLVTGALIDEERPKGDETPLTAVTPRADR